MRISLQKVIAVLAAGALMVIAYYADYLPLKKSDAFITALRNMGNVKSLDEFKQNFSYPLDIPSPIGQEELVRNLGGSIVNIINANGENNPALVGELLKYLDSYYQPIMQTGRGMSFAQNVFILGNAYQAAYIRTKNPQYLARAIEYYRQGNQEVSSKRPQFLYGLFDVYRMAGDTPDAINIAQRILQLWPDDQSVQRALDQLMAPQAVPTSTNRKAPNSK
ncbi:MAG TPA: hypothetical protein VMC43_02235 [Candidatus Paceibacterota bacterium]|nr:hypothetical protein [Candidatus Paceibacterota bacterium]